MQHSGAVQTIYLTQRRDELSLDNTNFYQNKCETFLLLKVVKTKCKYIAINKCTSMNNSYSSTSFVQVPECR